jgi:hypothetical protein
VHTYNPRYAGGKDRRISVPAKKKLARLYLKKQAGHGTIPAMRDCYPRLMVGKNTRPYLKDELKQKELSVACKW